LAADVKTWTAMIDASGATPRLPSPSPAAVPATWVPWPHSIVPAHGAAAPAPICSI
jgi:hypothetical protein